MSGKIEKRVISKSWLSILCLVFFACGEEQDAGKVAVHHLKSNVTLGYSDYSLLSDYNVERIYVRYFDVVWEEGKIKPAYGVNWELTAPLEMEVVPYVKINNSVLEKLDDSLSAELAVYTYARIGRINHEQGIKTNEIQIHSDFSPENKATYFGFLGFLKEVCERDGIELSVVLGLNHFQINQSTVPPAHRVMLLVLNTGDKTEWKEKNSIIHPEHGVFQGLDFYHYPLPIDLGLPLYSWVLHYRNDSLIHVHSAWDERLLGDSVFHLVKENEYRAAFDSFIEDKYHKKAEIRKGDGFRWEAVSPGDLYAVRLKLAKAGLKTPEYLSLYHYNPEEFRADELKSIRKSLIYSE